MSNVPSLFAFALAAAVTATPALSLAHPLAAPARIVRALPTPQARKQQTDQYLQWVEASTSKAQSRIATMLRQQQVAPALAKHILVDVGYGVELIRQRAQTYASDLDVTSWEKQQLCLLAEAIRVELAKQYGDLDSWQLLG